MEFYFLETVKVKPSAPSQPEWCAFDICQAVLYCPDPNVLALTNNKKVTVNGNRCKGCGLCVAACPKKAVAVKAV